MEQPKVINLNKDDVQSKAVLDPQGICSALYSGECRYGGGEVYVLIPAEVVLRRLTPTECARLQGMPDWWCDDVTHSDSAEYKMWGNGMALPCVMYVMEGIANALREEENK